MTAEKRDSVVFGDYELDMATRQLRHLGEPVALQPRVLELLAFLIQERERAVDKDAIQDAVWSGTIVSETALTRAIMKARRAVGDSADKQAVIRTVHGHGYQFVADVQTFIESPDSESTSTPSDPAQPDTEAWSTENESSETARRQAHSVRWLLAATLAAVAIGVLWVLRAPAVDDAVRVAILPVHNATDSEELDWVKLGLLGFASDLMQSSTNLQVVPPSDMVGFAEHSEWKPAAGADAAAEQLSILRRVYGASHVLFSEIESTVGGLRLSYTLFGSSGAINRSTMVSEESTELVRGMIREVNAALSDQKYMNDATYTTDGDPFISEAYARGVSHSLSGRCSDALPLFQIVLDRSATNFDARFQWANCARILGKPDEAESALLELVNELKDSEHTVLRSRSLGALGTVYHITGRMDDADTVLTEGLQLAQISGDKNAIGKLLNAQALLAKNRREIDKAKQLLARAALAYREAGREILPGQVHSALANLAMGEGKWNEAEEHLIDALTSFRALGDRRNEAMMLNNYGYLRRQQDRAEESEPFHLESLAIRREIGDRVGQGRILGMLSNLYGGEGRYEEARDMAQQAIAIATDANDTLFMATGHAQLAAAEAGLARPDIAREAYQQSIALFEKIEDHSRMAQIELRLAELDMNTEQMADAERRVQRVLDLALREDMFEVLILATETAADLAARMDDASRAQVLYEQALELIDQHNFKARRDSIRLKLGHLYLDEGQLDLAEPLLGFVLADGETAAGNKLHARYEFMRGDDGLATRLLESARDLDPTLWTDEDERTLTRYRNASAVQ